MAANLSSGAIRAKSGATPDFGVRDFVARGHIDLMPLLADQDQLRLWIEITRNGKPRAASLVAQEIEPDLYFFSSRAGVYWDGDFETALALIGADPENPASPEASQDAPPATCRPVEMLRQRFMERS